MRGFLHDSQEHPIVSLASQPDVLKKPTFVTWSRDYFTNNFAMGCLQFFTEYVLPYDFLFL